MLYSWAHLLTRAVRRAAARGTARAAGPATRTALLPRTHGAVAGAHGAPGGSARHPRRPHRCGLWECTTSASRARCVRCRTSSTSGACTGCPMVRSHPVDIAVGSTPTGWRGTMGSTL
ncbi:hypothetical protein NKH18_00260 [Streptomyces sp. M10(2022)]